MTVLIIVLAVLSVLQLIVCHFSLWWIMVLIARVLFSFRRIGATFKVKGLCILEGVAWACMIVFNMIFAKGHIPWFRILFFFVFSLISCGVMFFDDLYAVYVVEDDVDDEDSDYT